MSPADNDNEPMNNIANRQTPDATPDATHTPSPYARTQATLTPPYYGNLVHTGYLPASRPAHALFQYAQLVGMQLEHLEAPRIENRAKTVAFDSYALLHSISLIHNTPIPAMLHHWPEVNAILGAKNLKPIPAKHQHRHIIIPSINS